MKKTNKTREETWLEEWGRQKEWINKWLHNTWGLDDDDLLNAGSVEELCESIVYDAIKEFGAKK